MKIETDEDFSEFLQCKRAKEKLRQGDLAKLAGLSRNTIGNIESEANSPTLYAVLALLKALNCKMYIEEAESESTT